MDSPGQMGAPFSEGKRGVCLWPRVGADPALAASIPARLEANLGCCPPAAARVAPRGHPRRQHHRGRGPADAVLGRPWPRGTDDALTVGLYISFLFLEQDKVFLVFTQGVTS